MKRKVSAITYLLIVTLLCSACASSDESTDAAVQETAVEYPAFETLDVSAPGNNVEQNEFAVIDYSNSSDGYVMVQYTGDSENELKVQVKTDSNTYTYSLTKGVWAAFPFSEGDGVYQVGLYENVAEKKYALVLSTDITVTLNSEFDPFLRPNQYVDFSNASNTLSMARSLTKTCANSYQKVASIYEYVVDNIAYDTDLAQSVTSDYLPVLDDTLSSKKGICFDYAALMTGMLRITGVPCKLVIGYAGDAYHAWISVWVDTEGWIDNVIHFDGTSWQLMDPTFASADSSNYEFIGDGANYSAKYFY